MHVAIIGLGAIGSTIASWLYTQYSNLWLVSRGETKEALRKNGLTSYKFDDPENTQLHSMVTLLENLEDLADMDMIITCVKNYSLENVAKMIKENVGENEPVIVSMANGTRNQEILPKYFKHVVYTVIVNNAYKPEPSKVGYKSRGPLIFGVNNPRNDEELGKVVDYFKPVVHVETVDKLQDAVHSKMVVNLVNSINTLIGLNISISLDELGDEDLRLLHEILGKVMYEGVVVLEADDFEYFKVGDMPSKLELWANAYLPWFLVKGRFLKKLRMNLEVSSMTSDVLVKRKNMNELEDINGYFIKKGVEHGLNIPYNEKIYILCKKLFKNPEGFKPLTIKELYHEINN